MDFTLLFQQIFNSLLLGSTYALVALGLTLVLGTLDILNFAHSETIMVGAYVGLISIVALRISFPVVLVVSMLVGGAIAIPIYVFSFRLVNKSVWSAPILSTLGMSLLLTTGASRIWGSDPLYVPDKMSTVTFYLGPVMVSLTHIVIFSITALIMVGIHLFLKRTRTGRALRAVAENYTVASLLGVHVERVIAITLIISGLLAGVTGVLTSFVYHTITPFIGLNLLNKGMTGMVLGGLGNVYGAMIGGVIVGFLETMTVGYWSATYQDALVFMTLVGVLMFRPSGIFGVRIQERA